MRILVVSDFHVCDPGEDDLLHGSHLELGQPVLPSNLHPVGSFYKFINDAATTNYNYKADLVLCPGDFGDRGNREGITYGWSVLSSIAKAVDAPTFCGTVGNHDITKDVPVETSRAFLKALVPPFPLGTPEHAESFWRNSYCIVSDDRYNLCVIDSSLDSIGAEQAIKRGKTPSETIDAVVKEWSQFDAQDKFNILLCHHHPIPHEELNLGADDLMVNGSILVDKLAQLKRQALIVHGHKHHPKLSYSGAAGGPIVFAAGSFSAIIGSRQAAKISNQIHYITLETELGSSQIMGLIESFDWIPGEGWVRAQGARGLPHNSGFGCRQNISDLAQKVLVEYEASNESRIPLFEYVHECRYLNRQDASKLKSELKVLGMSSIDIEDGDILITKK